MTGGPSGATVDRDVRWRSLGRFRWRTGWGSISARPTRRLRSSVTGMSRWPRWATGRPRCPPSSSCAPRAACSPATRPTAARPREPDRVAREVKRRLGDPMPVLLGGTPYSAGDLMAAQLREVVAQISEREGGPPVAVRLTHPANWGPYKRELFEQVPRMAGLSRRHDDHRAGGRRRALRGQRADRRRHAPSPSTTSAAAPSTPPSCAPRAAASRSSGRPRASRASAASTSTRPCSATSTAPSTARSPRSTSRTRPPPARSCACARTACWPRRRSPRTPRRRSPCSCPSLQTEVRLTRGEFETMIRPSVASTIASLQRALESADISAEQVDTVLLVGGSSRIPLVSQMVSAELGRPTSVDAHPKHAIVLGAASLAEPPARAAGPGAPGPAHTSVFPTSGAPFRTPVPRVGPRTPPGGIPVGGSGRPASTPAAGRATAGVGHQLRDDPDRRGPAALLHRWLLHGVAHGDARPAARWTAGHRGLPRRGRGHRGDERRDRVRPHRRAAHRRHVHRPDRPAPHLHRADAHRARPSGPRPDRGDGRRPQPGPPDPGRSGRVARVVRAAPAVAGHPRRRWAAGRATTSRRPAGRAAGSP